jgi:hypothetical protein
MLEPQIAALHDGAVDHLCVFVEPSLVLLRTSRRRPGRRPAVRVPRRNSILPFPGNFRNGGGRGGAPLPKMAGVALGWFGPYRGAMPDQSGREAEKAANQLATASRPVSRSALTARYPRWHKTEIAASIARSSLRRSSASTPIFTKASSVCSAFEEVRFVFYPS